MEGIYLIPIGDIDQYTLNQVMESLQTHFHCKVRFGNQIEIPRDSFNSKRRQYHSTTILRKIGSLRPNNFSKVLGIIDKDLYVAKLNFVFGEANLSTGIAIISITRLRQEFYGSKQDKNLFYLRAAKEAIHEIGHTFGLSHCANPKCIMYFSNSLSDTDIKGPGFCNVCKKKLNAISTNCHKYY